MSSLLEEIADEANLTRAFARSYRPYWALKSDMGRQYIQVRSNLDVEIRKLHQELLCGTYVYSGADALLVPGRNKLRGVYRSCVRDRWVQQAVYQVIKSSVPSDFWSPASYGRSTQREGEDQSIATLAKKVQKIVANKAHFVLETDIKNFFPSIDKVVVVDKILACLSEESLRPLLSQMVSTEIASKIGDAKLDEHRHLWDDAVGIPQGGILSPLFSNFYLNSFDNWIGEQGWSLFRYVDDLLVFCESEVEVNRAAIEVSRELKLLHLSVHELGESDKASICAPGESLTFVGIRFTAKHMRPTRTSVKSLLERITSLCTDGEDGAKNLHDLLTKVNNILSGWFAAYNFCDLPKGELRDYDKRVAYHIGCYAQLRGIVKRAGAFQSVEFCESLGLVQLASLPRKEQPQAPPCATQVSHLPLTELLADFRDPTSDELPF